MTINIKKCTFEDLELLQEIKPTWKKHLIYNN
ncbi:hypothetical protein J2T20_003169 [Paenibacillus wynnii]|nr:hypothetical protein [Paenibacillus wynnii]